VAISSDRRRVRIVIAKAENNKRAQRKAKLRVNYRNRMEEKVKASGLDALN
jgi:hypothetical protein